MAEAKSHRQVPIAVVGFACRLPGGNNNPKKLWDFLEQGNIASSKVPETRFNFDGHFDGSMKPKTMRQPGGMFISDLDPADFDAAFFEVGGAEAVAMAPDQRQMLEVVFEGLENAGVPLEKLDNQPVGCFVGSYAADYADMQNRDPEDRPPNNALGVGRAILANRLSHFLNIHGPSVTLDTACSGSLQGLDLACRYLQSGDINAGIVATSNLYMSPEHLIDTGNIGSAHSPTALCHTFDVSADGYVKAEAVSCVIVKRLEDAIRDRDPIRAVVLGTASNSNGRTAGIASPSSSAQAMAIRAAYVHAGITDYNLTTYLECHGTGTQAGDPTEVSGIGSVFAASRSADKPLIIGSIKSNIGHSEPAAGISGLMKAILSIENGKIPGTPTFINPSPKIDFVGNKVKAYQGLIPWPENAPKRASINSFGYGGSNAHAIIEAATEDQSRSHVSSYTSTDEDYDVVDEDEEFAEDARPHVLMLSANDAATLKTNIQALGKHLLNPAVKVQLGDLAYTLSDRRSALWHRAFITVKKQSDVSIKPESWTIGKKSHNTEPTYGFVFTGQGAQWATMGKDLVENFPWTRDILEELDTTLQSIPDPPSWRLVEELTQPRSAEHLRQPEFSQPLVTALQLCLFEVLKEWGIRPSSVIGHSSGEIAGAYAAGFLDRSSAILAAFYRGRAALNIKENVAKNVGMLAVGLGSEDVQPFLEKYAGQAWIACFNSPKSITVSGKTEVLGSLRDEITAAGHFARLLQVDLAYHSPLMNEIGEEYERLLSTSTIFKSSKTESAKDVAWFSSVSANLKSSPADASYWKENMVNPVRFAQGLNELMQQGQQPNYLIELGPSGALAGPISQVLKGLPSSAQSNIAYIPAWARGSDAGKTIFDLAGKLVLAGAGIDLGAVNQYTHKERTIIDLPNYTWNHSTRYWHENAASKDWRFRKYVVHDLLGSKTLGSSWHQPQWKNRLNTENVPWLRDHRMGGDTIMPGAGFVTMGLEALYQKHKALLLPEEAQGLMPNDLCYRFRDVRFLRALVLEDGKDAMITTTLFKIPGGKDWHEFRISTIENDVVSDHCSGHVRIQDELEEFLEGEAASPLKSPQAPRLWYKCQREIGMEFGPTFQKLEQVEAVNGVRACRTITSMEPAPCKYRSQSYYPIHPAALDGCLQTVVPSNASCDRTNVKHVMIPQLIDEFIINKNSGTLTKGKSTATSNYGGRGRKEIEKSWVANTSVYDIDSNKLLMRITGLNYVKLDVAPKPDPHTFHAVYWKPDISLLTQDQIMYMENERDQSKIQSVIDLVAFKKPELKVLEINLNESDASSLWLSGRESSSRSAYDRYDLLVPNAKSLVELEQKYDEEDDASFTLLQTAQPTLGLSTDSVYDLLVVKSSEEAPILDVDEVVATMQTVLSDSASILLLKTNTTASPTGQLSDSTTFSSPLNGTSSATPDTSSQDSDAEKDEPTRASSSLSSLAWDEELASKTLKSGTKTRAPLTFVDQESATTAYLSRGTTEAARSLTSRPLIVASLSEGSLNKLPPALGKALAKANWKVSQQVWPVEDAPEDAVVLVVDELVKPVLRNIDASNWEPIKSLVNSHLPTLWVTKGAQGQVTNPDNSMVNGLFRVARQEDPSLQLFTLDVASSTSPASSAAIDTVLRLIKAGSFSETEYMERDGIIHVQRIMPDKLVNSFRHAEEHGFEPVVKKFHGTEVQVKLHAERLGTLNSLTWCETEQEEPELIPTEVEVEVQAVGVNFKDVAITMGIVPDNEYNIGFECAGVVKRIGSSVTDFSIGDRVCMLKAGCYANRVRVAAQRCHIIPSTMSFEEAATIPSVYLCSLYAMYHLGCLKDGQSILIHSATGGVGIACIQLAQYKKADIFVTVGTEEKRKFLEENYGIPRNRMFSSRNTKFAGEIMKATNGRGVDCVINSLIGELLDSSWRIMADGGNMVEIGKRDIVDRNTLSMEPFDRNCSFRAVDMSYTKDITDSLVAGLFKELFVLINGGHLKPITPITTFGFDDVISALAYIRSGRHLGKIVITNGEKEDIDIPIRPVVPELTLKSNASYLIVGGLRGACGTLAIKMAQHGAKHIIVSSRSGINDDASSRIIDSCNFYGCKVVEARGDIGDFNSTLSLFKNAKPKIAGVIQGAMVLRDKPFENMTLDDWQTSVHAKVQGSWNIHHASLQAQKQPLDFFTMLSSTSGIVGNRGQANYAAANNFLDALASYRLGQGLRANTVDLGLIEDVGYVAEQDTGLESRFDKRQWTPINESMLRLILAYSIFQQDSSTPLNAASASQTITGIGFPLPKNSNGGLEDEPRFSFLFSGRAGGSKANEGSSGGADDHVEQAVKEFNVLNKSGSADAGALLNACVAAVSAQFVRILRLEAEPEAGRPLTAYGLDSLSAVELRNWIRVKLSAELTTLDITNTPSLVALCEKIIAKGAEKAA